jgi:hypothetical protein
MPKAQLIAYFLLALELHNHLAKRTGAASRQLVGQQGLPVVNKVAVAYKADEKTGFPVKQRAEQVDAVPAPIVDVDRACP